MVSRHFGTTKTLWDKVLFSVPICLDISASQDQHGLSVIKQAARTSIQNSPKDSKQASNVYAHGMYVMTSASRKVTPDIPFAPFSFLPFLSLLTFPFPSLLNFYALFASFIPLFFLSICKLHT